LIARKKGVSNESENRPAVAISLWRKIGLVPLNSLGEIGPQRRDIHDAFTISRAETAYPVFWGHDGTKKVEVEVKAVVARALCPGRWRKPQARGNLMLEIASLRSQ